MKIILSREEIKSIVAEHYGITAEFGLEISSERSAVEKKSNPSTASDKVFVVNSNNQVIDIKPKSDIYESDETPKKLTLDEGPGMKKCVICGQPFIPKTKKVVTCSRSCRSKYIYKNRISKGNPNLGHQRIDIEKYGLVIENFLNSSGKTASVDLEGLSLSGMSYRYNKAAKAYDYESKVKLSVNNNELFLVKK